MTPAEPNSSDFLKLRVNQLVEEALKSGGPWGTSGGMDSRVAKLEADVSHIQRDIGEIKTDLRESRTGIAKLTTELATLDAHVKHLPTKGFIVSAVLTTLAVIAALIVFQGNLQKAVGLPSAQSAQTSK